MDETELSFIRCPNCRSLVPAVASRCRMCGFILKDASSKQSPSDSDSVRSDSVGNAVPATQDNLSDERPSRVRQRTISVSGNSNFTSRVEESKPEVPPVLMPIASPEPVELSQIEVKPSPSVDVDFEESEELADDINDYEGVEDDDFIDSEKASDNLGAVSVPESELVKKKRRRRRRRKKPAVLGIDSVPIEAPAQSASPGPEQMRATAPASTPAVEVRPEPVVVAPPSAAKISHQAEEAIAPWRTPPVAESRPGFRIEQKIEQKIEEKLEPIAPITVEARGKVENQRIPESRQEARQAPVAGSLVGWLVSFAEDQKGISHELRDGRFFVGREQLRASDFVIDHNTVSTPQCLVVCDPVAGVTIQDLMSERGTTLIRGSAALEKSSEQVRLENGDRIRFGEYEMLFVKLPQVR